MLEPVFEILDAYSGKPTQVFMQTSHMGTDAVGMLFAPKALSPYTSQSSVERLLSILGLSPDALVCPYLGVPMRPKKQSDGRWILTGGFDPRMPFRDSARMKYAFSKRLGKTDEQDPETVTISVRTVEAPFVPRPMPTAPKAVYMEEVEKIARRRKPKTVVSV